MSTYNEVADQIHGVYHRLRLTLNGNVLDDIPNNVKFNNMANDSAGLEIGTAYCSKITFEITDPGTDIANQEVLIEDGVRDSDGSFVWSPIGYFMATDAPLDRGMVSYTLYDRMAYKLSGQYTTSLTFPTTDKAIIEEICSRCGVTMVGVLTAHTISTMPTGTNRDVLSSMLQLQGKNAFFNAAGQLEIKWYTDSGYTVKDSQIYYDGDASVKEAFSIGFIKNTRTVQKTVTKEEDQTDYDENGSEVTKKVSYTEETSETETYTAGDGVQGVSFENPYMTQDIVNELYEKLKTFSYTPAKFRIVGDFRIKAMDIISVTTRGKTYNVPVMCIDHSCDGGLISEISSYGESESASTVNEGNSNSKAFARYDAELAYLKTVYANTLNVNKAHILYAEIKDLHATNAVIKKLDAETVKTINLEAEVAKFGYVTANTVEAQYARLDKANIGTGWIDSAMIGEGVVGTVQIADGSITDAKIVELTANKITAGTLSVERLEIRGTANSIVYALNNITGALQAQNVDTLNGEILTPRSITADRIVAGAITAKEIAAGAITTNHIIAGAITADKLDVRDLSAISAKIGGWELLDGVIRAQSGGKYCGIGREGIAYAFFAGGTASNGSNGVFRVGHDGSLVATNAAITGNITATSFSMNQAIDSVTTAKFNVSTTGLSVGIDDGEGWGGWITATKDSASISGHTVNISSNSGNVYIHARSGIGISTSQFIDMTGEVTIHGPLTINGGDISTAGGLDIHGGWMDFKYGGALYGSIYCNGTANHFEIVSRNVRDVAITSASGHIYARNTLHTQGGIDNDRWMDWRYSGSNNLSIYVEERNAFIRANSGHLDILTSEALVQFVDYSWSTWATLKAKNFAVQSSRRYKTNVFDMTEERAKRLLDMRPVSYDYAVMGCEKDQLGLIAEEVEPIDKYSIAYDEYGRPDSIDYSKFVPQLIKLCQMQQTEIENIKMRLGNIGTVS